MSQVCCLAGMDTDSTGPICNDKHCQGLEQNGQQLKKMLLRGPIRFSSGRPPNQGSNKIAGEMTGRCASVPASGNQHSTGLRKTLEACCIYPVLIPGSHPELTISAKFRRNFGKFSVSTSYREKKFRYISVFSVLNLENSKKL